MSLVIAIKGPEGIVLAADTRVTISPGSDSREAYFDNSSKLLTIGGPHKRVAALTYGAGSVSGRMISGLMSEFQQTIEDARLTTLEYAQEFSRFFTRWWSRGNNTSNFWFLIGGVDDKAPYGDLYSLMIPGGELSRHFPGSVFGIRWGGQTDIVNRIILGYDPKLASLLPDVDAASFETSIPYALLSLQDCINLAIVLIKTTMTLQSLSLESRGVGGTIEVLVITPNGGVQWVQKRELHGELESWQ